MASTTIVTGLALAKACSQPGMVKIGTNALLANVSGKTHTNPADWAASTLPTESPMTAEIHENAIANRTSSPSPPTMGSRPLWNRKPTSRPTPVISTTTRMLRRVSARMRPASTANRVIGSDRNLSTMLRDRSSARPMPVWVEPKAIVCTKIPGIRKST